MKDSAIQRICVDSGGETRTHNSTSYHVTRALHTGIEPDTAPCTGANTNILNLPTP